MELKEVARYPSSSSSKVYVVKQDEDGNLSCDCPAWRFKKPNQERSCKHTKEFAAGNIPAAPVEPAPVAEQEDPDQVMAELLAETEPKPPTWKPLGEALEDLSEAPAATFFEQPDKVEIGGVEWDVVSVYTRAQAIEDGVLVDVSETAAEAGIKYPTVVTRRVWDEVVTPDDRSRPLGQSEAGRLWDVLYMFMVRARVSNVSEFQYQLSVIQKAQQRRTVTLKAHCGPGDTAEPVITIMFPNED